MTKILTPEHIRQPKRRLKIDHQAHVMGAPVNLREAVVKFYGSEVLVPNSDGSPFCDDFDVQRNAHFEPSDCVTCAHQNAIYGILKWKYGEYVKQSRKFTAKDSGTEPGAGNSNWNVELSIMRTGMVAEIDYPSLNVDTTEAEFYQQIPKEVYLKEDFLKYYDVKFIPLPVDSQGRASQTDIDYAMSISPWLVVSVNGHYAFNNAGQVVRISPEDSHDIIWVRKPIQSEYLNRTVDSENQHGFVPFAPEYEFHYPILVLVKKKYQPMLYKLKDQPAIYVKAWDRPLLRSFSDGKIPGGDMFKDLYGISDYGQLQINHVDVLPYPVDGVQYTTI